MKINKIENKSQGALIGTIEINNKKLEKIISNANMFFSIFLSDKIPNTRTGRLIAAKKYSGLSIVINNNINPQPAINLVLSNKSIRPKIISNAPLI